MKFAFLLLLACLSICLVKSDEPKITVWGQITSHTLGTKNVVVSSSMWQIKNFTFTYPEEPSTYIIRGIQHMDFKSHPVTVRFLKGGNGERNVTLQVQSQRGHGINSTFVFFTD